ncbi:MAG: hypothetical protein E7463_09035 [Ruminococcaceae bacterium]|nr:hypothetical protein [Oscillospiraceae bacterium]
MESLKTLALLALYMFCKTGDVVWLKRAQPRDGTLWQNLHFTWLFCLLQAVFMLFLPPYQAMHFEPAMFFLPILFSIFYIGRVMFTVYAANAGPMALSQIIISFNTLFPVIAGILFWDETLRWWQVVGLLLFCTALPLFNSGSYSEGAEKKPLTLKWLIYSLLSLTFSGLAVTCTKLYSARFEGAYIKEYLFLYAVSASVILLPVIIHMYRRRRAETTMPKSRWINTGVSALSLDAANVVFMMFIGSFSSALYFPMISVISVCGVLFAGRVFLKERVSRHAWIGVGLSALALMLLAIS